jgi:aspartate racemase
MQPSSKTIFYLHCMKVIGFIGGLTWLSSLDYYRLLNELTNEKLGGVSSCEMIMYSVNFQTIKDLTFAGDWDGIAAILSKAAQNLEGAGADCVLIGANTMHHVADKVQRNIQIPLIHIAEATATVVAAKGLTKVALLGTKYTMLLDFYKNKLAEKNIEILVPGEADIEYINDTIYNEMSKGIFLPERKERFIQIINSLQQQGAQGVVLGCTELPILVKQQDIPIPVLDTTLLHVQAAVAFASQ